MTLFREHGYDSTTVEQIAAAAEVSPSTFFRYFGTKDDVVLTEDYTPLLIAALEEQPAALSPVQAMRAVVAGPVVDLYRHDRAMFHERIKLIYGTPALRAGILEGVHRTARDMASALARRRGLQPDCWELQVAMSAMMAAIVTVVEEWSSGGGRDDLPRNLDRALRLLETGMAVPSTSRPHRDRR